MVRNPSGEGGDVELGARTLEKFSVFAFGLLALLSLLLLLALHCSLQYSLVLGDCCITIFNLCID